MNSVTVSLAALLAGVAPAPSRAATEVAQPVFVTATRFQSTTAAAPVNVSVITHEAIERSGAANLADVLAAQAGIQVKPLFGVTAADASLDMGGFGSTGASNTLVLLNGRRLNDVDLSGTNLAAIPLDDIARIEVLYGSASVLYGDNAAGGAINIITRDGFDPLPSAVAIRAGTFQTGAITARASGHNQRNAFIVSGESLETNGYRDHNDSTEKHAYAELTRADGDRSFGLRALVNSEQRRFPGALNEPDYEADPRAAGTTPGEGHESQRTVEGFFAGESLAAELAYRHKDQSADIFGVTHGKLDTTSFTPRYTTRLTSQTLIAGVDLYRSRLRADGDFGPGAQTQSDTTRDSLAAYVNDAVALGGNFTLNLGARRQGVHFATDSSGSGAPASMHAERRDWLTVWDTTLSYRHPGGGHAYLRAAESFRFAVLDEVWSYYSGDISLLKPQRGRHIEAGATIPVAHRLTFEANAFRMALTDEIGFDLASYANVNLDPTRHDGANLGLRFDATDALILRAGYAYRRAYFRAGPNAGSLVPEVPRDRLTVGATARLAERQTLALEGIYTGSRYFGDDYANAGKMMPCYTLWNAAYTYTAGPWKLKAAVNNIADTGAADAGYYNSFAANPYYYYPLPGRAFLLSLSARL
jgi:iron complex outermembrane recepter protein